MKMNKYRAWYDLMMTRASSRALCGYSEKHHVLPKSIGGSNAKENIVRLTYREHFLAHWLLTKFTEGMDKRKMQHALSCMTMRRKNRAGIISGWQYELTKQASASVRKGIPRSEETKRKLSAALKGRTLSEEVRKRMSESSPLKGKRKPPHSEETRKKIGDAFRGRKHTEEHNAKISAGLKANPPSPWKGKKFTEEHKAKISLGVKRTDACRGRKLTEEHKKKLWATRSRKWSDEQRQRWENKRLQMALPL